MKTKRFIIALFCIAAFGCRPASAASTKQASKEDVRFVLNWCTLGDDRIEEVVHSYVSSRSFTGDHLDAYAIRISHVDEAELKKDDFGQGWTRCDQTTGVLNDALSFVQGWLPSKEIPWFPSSEELRSKDMYVFPWRIDCAGTKPNSVELIFVRPRDKMVFFISCKT